MKLLVVASILSCAWAPVWSQTPKPDTIVFIGKCRYESYSQTVHHIGERHYFFEVVNVIKGTYTDRFISFMVDDNSIEVGFFTTPQKGEPVNLSPDSIFYGHDSPIDQVRTCTSDELKVEVVRYEKDFGWPEKTIVVYSKTWKRARKIR